MGEEPFSKRMTRLLVWPRTQSLQRNKGGQDNNRVIPMSKHIGPVPIRMVLRFDEQNVAKAQQRASSNTGASGP